MVASENSYLGLAIQGEEGLREERAAQFKYLLFREGSMAPQNIVLPLDPEVGGGAMLRSMVKVGVTSGGGLDLIPRPDTLGLFLYGATGGVTTSADYQDTGILGATALGGQVVSVGITNPPSAKALYVVGSSALALGDIIIAGTVGGSPDSETIALNGTTRAFGVKLFTAVTSITLPTVAETTASVGFIGDAVSHVFKLPTDQFQAPFFTMRHSPGALWGESMMDCRLNMVTVAFRSPGFVNGAVGFVGGMPEDDPDFGDWGAHQYIDGGPQFLTPISSIEVPTGEVLKVLSGSFTAMSNIPMDEQFVVGSYSPEGFDIVSRSFVLNLAVKIRSEVLYKKIQYDPAGGSEWTASLFNEGNINILFNSDRVAAAGSPYSFKIEANGQSGENANVVWSAEPVALRAQRQVVMNLTGTFLASPDAQYDPIVLTLVNQRASYGYVAPPA
jgi:hypothetical protein